MYNTKFTIPESQQHLEKLFKVFHVIYNAARDFEVSIRHKNPRPSIDFTASQVICLLKFNDLHMSLRLSFPISIRIWPRFTT